MPSLWDFGNDTVVLPVTPATYNFEYHNAVFYPIKYVV